ERQMSGGVVCYIERSGGGTGIRRLRLVAAGLARTWTAPEGRSVSSVDAGPGPALGAARAGATWMAGTLGGVGLSRLAGVYGEAGSAGGQWKRRYAVGAVEVAVVRVLLDELDARGVEVGRVVTLWHAMAAAWDRAEPASVSRRLVSTDS